jgi:site-specific DNA recombinase
MYIDPMTSKRVAGYLRLSVSTDESTSIDGQRAVIERWASTQGSEVTEIYIDDGFSGSKDIERPAYDRLCADVAAGLYDAVAVKSLDRLGRRLRAFLEFVDLAATVGCRVVAVESGLDTGTPTGRLMLSLLSVFAEHEAAAMGERQKVSQAQRRAQPARALGAPSFGFRNVKRDGGTFREIDPAQAEIAVDLAHRLIDGSSFSAEARRLNDAGVKSSKGAAYFTAAQVSQLIRNPALRGMRTHKGEVVRDADGLPIVNDDLVIIPAALWRDLDLALTRRSDHAPRTRLGRERLAYQGIVTCSGCGKPMAHSQANGYSAYRCTRKIRRECTSAASVKASVLDEFVDEQMQPLFALPVIRYAEVADENALQRRAFLATEIDGLAARIASACGDEILDLAQRISALRGEHDSVEVKHNVTAVDTGETFGEVFARDRRAAVEQAVETIQVRQAKGSHEPIDARTVIVWRDEG